VKLVHSNDCNREKARRDAYPESLDKDLRNSFLSHFIPGRPGLRFE
jgi:hypothetical protein